jgi:two-component system sensor histidine kinase YesM
LGKLVNPARAAGGESTSYGILVNSDNLVLSHPDPTAIGRTLSEEEGEDHLVLPRNMITLEQPVSALNLTLMRVVDRGALLEDANRYTRRMALVLIVLTALFILGVGSMVQRIIHSVRRLRAGLEQVEEGNLDALVRTRQVNEIGQIIASFNRMTARLKQMGLEREQESRRAIEALYNLRAAEIRALENQIDSHFLHNTLSTISYTAIHAGDHDASRQIQHLSKMLRYTFERSTGVVTVQEEADWLRDYLELQRLRFGSAIDYKIIIRPDVADWPVHKLVLQPFVENSLLHGLEGGLLSGVIEVRIARFDEKRIRVTIRDNGRGMERMQVERLNRCFRDGGNAGEGIGLENAALRVRSYYRGGARVIFRSWQGVGTAVTLILPKAFPHSPSAHA